MGNKKDEWQLEQEETGEFGGEDRPGETPVKTGTMIAVFCGLAVLAAIICGILWRVTHKDRDGDDGGAFLSGAASTPAAGESQEPGGGAADASQGEDGSQEPESGAADASQGEDSPQEPGSGAADASQGEDSPQESESGAADVSQGEDGSQEPGGGAADVSQGEDGSQEPGSGAADASQGSEKASQGQGSASAHESGGSAPAVADPNRVSTLDGRVIVFTDCDDMITPKIYVNLRTEPSTSEGDSTVYRLLNGGEKAHRTGISEDSGWSRVEENGAVYYVVTSYVIIAEAEEQ